MDTWNFLFLVFLKDQGCIVAAETESIGKDGFHVAFLSLIEGEVEVVVNLRIIVALLMVDSGRHDAVGDGLYAEDRHPVII